MPLLKRSVTLKGHRTSLALESDFWAVLDQAAEERNRSLASLISIIDARRDPEDALSSAVRVWALRYITQKLATATVTPDQDQG